jgi:hypothetical protein
VLYTGVRSASELIVHITAQKISLRVEGRYNLVRPHSPLPVTVLGCSAATSAALDAEGITLERTVAEAVGAGSGVLCVECAWGLTQGVHT